MSKILEAVIPRVAVYQNVVIQTLPPILALLSIDYDKDELGSIPESSILGVGCGAPLNFANLKENETVVDLG